MPRTTVRGTKAKTTQPASEKRNLQPHELVMSSPVQNAVGIHSWGKFAGDPDLAELVKGLRERIDKVHNGDMQPVEAMLIGQAMTLETIFTSLARRATSQEYLKQFQAYLSLALKAQAQCRATLEALAEIKNPRPVLIAKQANVANGPQQVNNGMQPAQQAGSVKGGGRAESLPAPGQETAPCRTRGFFSPGAEIQQSVGVAQTV